MKEKFLVKSDLEFLLTTYDNEKSYLTAYLYGDPEEITKLRKFVKDLVHVDITNDDTITLSTFIPNNIFLLNYAAQNLFLTLQKNLLQHKINHDIQKSQHQLHQALSIPPAPPLPKEKLPPVKSSSVAPKPEQKESAKSHFFNDALLSQQKSGLRSALERDFPKELLNKIKRHAENYEEAKELLRQRKWSELELLIHPDHRKKLMSEIMQVEVKPAFNSGIAQIVSQVKEREMVKLLEVALGERRKKIM